MILISTNYYDHPSFASGKLISERWVVCPYFMWLASSSRSQFRDFNNQILRFDFHACRLSCFSRVRLLATLWTVAHQVPLSMGLSRQEYWRGLPCHPLEDLPDPEIEPASPALAVGFFTIPPPRKPFHFCISPQIQGMPKTQELCSHKQKLK